jgi:hypothetical protein
MCETTYDFVRLCITTFLESIETFFVNTYTRKGGVPPMFLNFLCSLQYFNIYSLVNHKIITVIGKLGQKFA